MKILICTNHSYMFWQFRRELTQALLNQGQVVISTPFVGHEDDLEAMGCKLVKTEMARRSIDPLGDLQLFSFFWHLLKTEKPDLVITYSIKPNIYCGIACQLQKIPYCVNVQGLGTAFQTPGLASIVSILYRIALARAKTTFFENEGNAREFRRRKIQTAGAQTLLNGAGVNLDHYCYQPYPHNDPVRFLYVGRFMREKGMDELIWAARKLKEDGERFVLDLVGFYEDEYSGEIEKLVYDGIANFHGFQSDPRPFYAGTDCVVLPSYHEGMSNVLLEAAAIGRPLITSDIHGCAEAVEDGVSGLLCAVSDNHAVYEKMKQLLHMDRSQREAMGKAGRARMEQLFDKNFIVAQTIEALMAGQD